jgi:CheY-like chemotaxis protein
MPGLDGFGVAERIRKDVDLVCGPLVMLTSAGEQGESQRCRELGVAGYLMKPVAASDLRRVIETVMKTITAPVTPEEVAAPVPVSNSEPVRLAPASDPTAGVPLVGANLRLLLAEDNPVNRTIGTRMLSKYGHVVVAVENGALAVEATAKERFDVVLMDVEMPVMNGFDATAAIRAREQGTDVHVPIIALTAHAMQGDRERCLEAGMDSYATKPIQPTELFSTVAMLLKSNPPEVAMSIDVPALDRVALYEQVGDEADLLLKVIEMFRVDSVQVMAKLADAVATGNAEEVQQGAHRLKGALLTLGGKPAAEFALQLEQMGRRGELAEAAPALAQLRHELTRLEPELEAVTNSLPLPTAAAV